MSNKLVVRKALVTDVKSIHALLMQAAQKGQLLPRALTYLYGHIRNFLVVEDQADKTVIGCSALAPVWEDLAEICSLVVREDRRGEGIGRLVVNACLAECPKLGITKVFALTYQDKFFNHVGFATVDKDILPQKIWADCVHCPKYPDCDENAVLKDLGDKKISTL